MSSKLPAYVNAKGAAKIKARVDEEAKALSANVGAAPASVDGEWVVTVKGPMGPISTKLILQTVGGKLTGSQSGDGATSPVEEAAYDISTGDINWINKITKPMKITSTFTGKVESNQMTGKVKAGFMGSFPFNAIKSS